MRKVGETLDGVPIYEDENVPEGAIYFMDNEWVKEYLELIDFLHRIGGKIEKA